VAIYASTNKFLTKFKTPVIVLSWRECSLNMDNNPVPEDTVLSWLVLKTGGRTGDENCTKV
jgi:hypothetical protein